MEEKLRCLHVLCGVLCAVGCVLQFVASWVVCQVMCVACWDVVCWVFGSFEEAFLKVVGHMLGSKLIAGRRLWSDFGCLGLQIGTFWSRLGVYWAPRESVLVPWVPHVAFKLENGPH